MAEQDRPDDISVSAEWVALGRFIAGECTAEESVEIRRTLAADPARAALVAALTPAEVVAPPTSSEVEAALVAVRARRDEPSGQPVGRPSKVLKLEAYGRLWRGARLRAAAAVLVVAGGALLFRVVSGPESASSSATSPSRFAAAVGALDSLRLPDGTRVLLGPGSELTLAADYGRDARELALTGEARFEVAHDATRPFVVHAASASFRDVGTVFAVHSDPAGGARIVVTEGAVAVQLDGAAPVTTLHAGDRAAIAPGGVLTVERSAVSADDLAWTKGRLTFRDAPVAQVAADLRRWYGLELRVDSALAARHLTATFERGPGDEVGSVIADALGGTLRKSGDTLNIVPAAARNSAR
jgi:transmembrane sensor